MAFEKKTWTDRIAEFINRRTLTKEDGSTELVTVARSEGTISAEGDAFNAETMNDLEKRIADGFDEVNTNLEELSTNVGNMATTFKFTCNGVSTSNGVYIKDPDGKPLKSGGYKIDLLSTTALTNEVASSYIINIAGGIFYKTVIHEGTHNASPRLEYNTDYGLYVLLANYSTALSVATVVTRL